MVSSTSTNLNLSSTGSITSANASGNKNTFKMNTSAKALNAQDQTQKKSTPTNVWGKGYNPVTQRPISTNGTPAPKSSLSSKGPPVPSKDANTTEKMPINNLAFLAANMKGLNATLTHKNGERYSGIFSSLSDKGYTIKMARKIPSSGKQSNGVTEEQVGEGPDRTLTLEVGDVIDCKVDGVRLDKSQGRAQNGVSSNFRTDTDISFGRTVRERDLQKWEGAPDSQVDMSLSGRLDGWDQFAAHKQMTGRDSTYDENNYTTKLDTSAPGYKEKLARAEKIAREIENSTTNNAHQAEERGQISTRDDGIDEEAKYSGVQRNFQPLASGQPNRYTPPARRAAGGPPPPTVATPADDPAIISSSRPESVAPKQAPAPAVAKPAESTSTPTPAPKEATATTAPSTMEKVMPPVPAIKSFASTQSSSTRVQPKEGGATETVEKDVVNAFKQFHAVEKMRIQEHLQSQRSAARRDKAVKLNDLKKFAENFKLNTEVPTDLIPILAKDKKKQQEIMDRAKKNTDEIKASTPPRATTTATTAPTDPKSAKATVNRVEPGVTSPQAPNDRQNQQRTRPNQPNFNSVRGVPAHMQQQMGGIPARPGGPGHLGQRLANQQQHRQNALANQHHQMPSQDPRMPPAGPASTSSGVQSPTSASIRWNPKASFTPNPASQTFVPSSNPSNGSSPVREPTTKPPPPAERKPAQSNLFEGRTEGRKGPIPASERVSLKTHFNPITRMKKEVEAAVEKGKSKDFAENGGIPEAYRTIPTWEVPEANQNKTIKDCFEPARKPSVSPQHPMLNQQPYQHQLPFHPQHGGPMQHGPTPQHTPRHHAAQLNHGGPGTPRYDDPHRMQYSQSTSSVQPSPQQMPQYPPFNGQAPQPNAFYPPQGYPVTGGQPMFVRQGSQGPQFYAQPPNGHMMAVQPNGAPYQMTPQMMYAPAQGQMFQQQGNGMPPQAPNGYGSPRGIPMSQQGSQQGHPQQMMYMPQPGQGPAMYPQGPGGPMTPMRGPFAQLAHQQPYVNSPQHFQQQPHRATPSGSYVQPNMMGGPPLGMAPNGAPMGAETVEDGK